MERGPLEGKAMERLLFAVTVVTAIGQAARAKEILGFRPGPVRDDVAAKELILDPPTLHNLGFRWFIEGDTNRSASVSVAFRRKGAVAWRRALPPLRVHHEVVDLARGKRKQWRAGNLFAGSVFGLRPGTAYEVRLVLSDPDGGAPGLSPGVWARKWDGGRLVVLPFSLEGSFPKDAG